MAPTGVGVHLGGPRASAAFRDAWAASRWTRRQLGGSARAWDSVFTGGSAHTRERAIVRERKRLHGKEKSRAPVPIERIRERQRHRERGEWEKEILTAVRRRSSSLLPAATRSTGEIGVPPRLVAGKGGGESRAPPRAHQGRESLSPEVLVAAFGLPQAQGEVCPPPAPLSSARLLPSIFLLCTPVLFCCVRCACVLLLFTYYLWRSG